MGSELVSSSFSQDETLKGGNSDGVAPFSYAKIIKENLPFYLSIGMTYDQYMNEDVELARYYRKAYQLQEERFNTHAWLQGMYVYEAIADVSPVLHAFAKSGTEIIPYSDEPYAITKEQRERKEQREAEAKRREMLNKMNIFAAGFNKQFNEKKQKEVN